MNIVLINPPIQLGHSISRQEHRRTILNIAAPLGIAYIAATLEKNNYKVKIFDCAIEMLHLKLIEYLKIKRPNIIGITATSLGFYSAKKIAEDIRSLLPKANIIIGGPHVTALPSEVMLFDCFDIGVIGEGELTFLELVKRIETSGADCFKDISGIVYRKNNKIMTNKKRDLINNLDDIPFPARHLLPPLSKYFSTIGSYRRLPLAHIISTRGCLMKCSFCDQSVFGSTYRTRSADNILEEIELLIDKFGAKEIKFFDDNFTWNKELVFEICDKIQERNIKFSWVCFASVNTVSYELLKRMKKAGCWEVSYGLESGDENVLKFLKSGITLAQNERAVKSAKKAGLSVRGHFVVGTPWESKNSLQKTLDFAKKSDIDYALFIKFIPYPGSEISKMLTKKGYYFDFNKRLSVVNNNNIMYIPEGLDKEELIKFFVRARKEFYFRFAYILRKFRAIRTWIQLKDHIIGVISLLSQPKN